LIALKVVDVEDEEREAALVPGGAVALTP